MKAFATKWLALGASVLVVLALISCSSTPTGPQPGSPEFTWSAAKQAVANADYPKALIALDKLASKQSELQAKAQPWNLVMLAGISKGYMDLAQTFESGAKNNRSEPLTFRTKGMAYQRQAGRYTMQFAEAYEQFSKTKTEQVPLAFDFPKGSLENTPHLQRVEKGMMPTQADIEAAQNASIDRGIVEMACAAAGTPGDAAKAADAFKAGQVPAKAFALAMASAFYDQAQLYGRKKLDDPSKVKMFSQKTADLLKAAGDSKEAKEINKKLQALMKSEKI
jgi:hypothetical protein